MNGAEGPGGSLGVDILEHLGKTEVSQDQPVFGAHQDILRLDIPVNDTHFVGAIQGGGDLFQVFRDLFQRQPARTQKRRKRPTRNKRHHQEGAAGQQAKVMDGQDVGMVERGHGAGFQLKPAHQFFIGS